MASKSNGMRQVRLGDIFTERKESGIAGLPVMSVTMDGGIVERSSLDRRVVSDLTPEQHLLARRGDIAYNMMRMWQGVSGMAKHDCLISPAYVVLEPSQDLDSEFAAYLLKSDVTIRKLHRFSQGVAGDRLRLYFDQLRPIRVQIPPKSAQKLIAKILRSVDVAIESTRAVIAQTRQLKSALLQDLLYASRQEKSKQPDDTRLSDAVSTWQYGLSEALSDEGRYACFRMNNYLGGRLVDDNLKYVDLDDEEFIRYQLNPGDILFNRTNSRALVGKVGIFDLDGDFVFASYLVRLVPDRARVLPEFLNLLLNTKTQQHRIRELATPGVSQSNINVENLKKLKVPIPTLDEQSSIIRAVQSVSTRESNEQAVLDRLVCTKSALSQGLLTGRIQVKGAS